MGAGQAERKLVWITKDDQAKRDHLPDIIRYKISVVWVRGVQRERKQMPQKNKISPRQLHLMLTVKLPHLMNEYEKAHGARHFQLFLNGERPAMRPLDPHTLRSKHERESQLSRRPHRA